VTVTGFGAGYGFRNPILGAGGQLIPNAIHSANYVPGVSGWYIGKDGTAQFYGLTITGGGFIANSDGQFFYQGPPALGNLILAITGSSASGTDQFGNVYTPGGVCIIGNPAATQLFSVIDQSTPPNSLASIASDGSFATQANLTANTDMFLAGNDLLSDLYTNPIAAQGVQARTNIFASNLPAPATPTSSEFFLYQLDWTVPLNGRDYALFIEPIGFALNQAGKVRLTVYATTDGTQPTNASPVLISTDQVCGGVTANLGGMRTPSLWHPFTATAGTLWRFLVSLNTFSTGAGAPTIQVIALDTNPGNDSQVNARFEIWDAGQAVPNTGRQILATSGGSGGGTSNYTKTYTATASHCYQGSDGGNPNLKINDNGSAYQGGNYSNTYNGKAKTWFVMPNAINSDLSGATINKVQVYLNNNHTWYGSGMTAAIGWDNKSSFGSTAGDPSGSGIDAAEVNFNEGQAKWVTVPNSFGTNFGNGNAGNIVLWKNSNNLQYYGFFAGGGSCQVKVSYTK
jgi:hypothetical protein